MVNSGGKKSYHHLSAVGVKDLVFNDEIEAVQAEVTRLQDDGVKIIIALGHAGYPKDQQIAAKVRGLDVVVGGHTNTFLYTGRYRGLCGLDPG